MDNTYTAQFAKFDKGFFGFSTKLFTILFLSISTIPQVLGLGELKIIIVIKHCLGLELCAFIKFNILNFE